MKLDIATVAQQIQLNCDIADASQAGDYTLCIYLLKMREFYRWEKQLGFSDPLPKKEIGHWLTEKETYWDKLEDQEFQPIQIGAKQFQPHEFDVINQHLIESKFIYSAGHGRHGLTHFFLGELLKHEKHSNFEIFVSGKELARDLTAPAGFTQGSTIFIRRESLRRVIWEKIEEWKWKQSNPAINRAMTYYDLTNDLDSALEKLTDDELDTVLLHEIGEIEASQLLGDQWHEMLSVLPRSQAELMARAVKDHIADCTSTLPALIQKEKIESIHFYFGNLQALRKKLFPSLTQAYSQWLEDNHLEKVEQTLKNACTHWREVAKEMLNSYQQHGPRCGPYIEKIVQNSVF